METREFKVLNDREHVLLRPGMYLGQVVPIKKDTWVYNREAGKFTYTEVEYVPALLKYISEIIDNSVDVAIDTDFKFANKIQVNITSTSVEVIDNGIGIPCVAVDGISDKPKDTCVVAAWTVLKSGTSFGENRQKIGTHGVGASCCNIFSKVFIGESDDGKHKQILKCKDNMTTISAGKIKDSTGKSGVRVYCEPDLEKFNLTEINEDHINLVYKRLLMLAISFPKITFIFNKQKINVDNKKFANMLSDTSEVAASDNTRIVVFPNDYDEFKSFSFVNGLETFRDGAHVDYVASEITKRIRDKLIKKYKSIKPGDIKNKICLSVILTNFNNPQFDGQTKESLSAAPSEISNHIDGRIDFDKLVKAILKNESIMEPIVDTFRIKEELKTRQELKKINKVKVKSDKYMSPIGNDRIYLALCEGQSAMSGISASLGREGIGYYAMRGVPLNAYDSTIQKIAANQELKDICNILELDISKSETNKTIAFDKIMITSDADSDGDKIAALLIGWFKKFAPNLFDEGKICRLITPVVITLNKKEQLENFFFSVADFKAWEAKNSNYKGNIIYLKGLGSHDKDTLIELFNTYGLDNFIVPYKLDKKGEQLIEDWLGDNAESRKAYLREFKFDINNI